MKKSLFAVGSCTTLAMFMWLGTTNTPSNPLSDKEEHPPKQESPKDLEPYDHWYTMRSYPEKFQETSYLEGMGSIKEQALSNADSRDVDLSLDWQQEGPGNIGGRFNVLTQSPTSPETIYAGSANGGIFKTTDGGDNWTPIFDALSYLAIGSITIDPTDESTIYVGTGDRNFGGGSHIGNGVYKSTDAGTTWESSGLTETGIITRLIIDPTDTDKLYASTLGNTYEKTSDRGIYRSADGGETWENILFLSDSSGVIDMVMDPSDPNTLYASGFNRINLPFEARISGPESKIYKTTDGGDSWTTLTTGLPEEDESRIGLAISNDDPNTLYALYVSADDLNVKDIYKTTDAGANWTALNVHDGALSVPSDALGGFGWYFGEIYLNPYDNEQLIIPGVDMFQSLDAGENWSLNVPEWWTYEVHADKHDIVFLDENSYIIATDGGLYKTDNNGAIWEDIENIPVTQFYHIAVHPHEDGLYGGGAQDNGSMSGNASSFDAWERLFGGDGFRVTFLDQDEGSAYYETQRGNLYYVGAGGEYEDVAPPTPGEDRVNWDMPYVINETDAELFAGTSRIQIMYGAPYGTYEYISDDLTRIGMGESLGRPSSHTISEIEQPIGHSDIIYAGTTDGLVWRGDRDGWSWNWTNITGELPNRYVTGIRSSPNQPGTVYVSFSGYRYNEEISYLYKSENFGETWTDISSDLPGITVNDILVVPTFEADQYLFAALDGGVYFSQNNGGNWDYVGTGLPLATITELAFDYPNKKLIAGTYSRSMWSYDVSWIDGLVDVTSLKEAPSKKLTLYPNPVHDLVYFDRTNAEKIQLFDASGKLVLEKKIQHFNAYSQANLTGLKTGIYYYQIGTYSGAVMKK